MSYLYRLWSVQRFCITLLATVLMPEIAQADLGEYDYESTFEVGGSCASLAYVEKGELQDTIAEASEEGIEQFCFSEEPYFCADYSSYLHGLGRMEVGYDGYLCRLVLN